MTRKKQPRYVDDHRTYRAALALALLSERAEIHSIEYRYGAPSLWRDDDAHSEIGVRMPGSIQLDARLPVADTRDALLLAAALLGAGEPGLPADPLEAIEHAAGRLMDLYRARGGR